MIHPHDLQQRALNRRIAAAAIHGRLAAEAPAIRDAIAALAAVWPEGAEMARAWANRVQKQRRAA